MLGNIRKGLVFVLSAPSGTGKTTLIDMLLTEFPSVVRSISYTTRKPRDGEVSGKDYYFVEKEEFYRKIAEGDFLEHVQLYGYDYGTSSAWVEDQIRRGKHVVLVIDTQGALILKKKFQAVFIFVKPPSPEELKKRLMNRRTEDDAKMKERLNRAEKEIEISDFYDYRFVNDDLKVGYQVLRSIIIAESHRVIPSDLSIQEF